MTKSKTELSRGVLNKTKAAQHFSLSRFGPSDELAYFVEHYWVVRWDLRGKEPYQQDVLAHPSVHLVFEQKNTFFWGVVTGKFVRELKDKGHVLGIKFRPGAFFPFYQKSVASFTNDVLPFDSVFNANLDQLEKEILSPNDDKTMADRAEKFLLKFLPSRDPRVEEINQIMDFIMKERSILKVDDLLAHFNYSKRTLQRLFKQYVGVNPKWVIQRYRLHEVAEKIAAGEIHNWPALAVDAGYFDQAHFIRDFKAIVGQTPAEYAREAQK